MANVIIQEFRSSTPTNVPGTLQYGRIAINAADNKVFYGNTSNLPVEYNPILRNTTTFVVPAVYGTVNITVPAFNNLQNNLIVNISDGTTTFIGQITSGGKTSTLTVTNLAIVTGSVGATMAIGASIEGSSIPYTPGTYNVRQFGAKCDGRWVIDAALPSGSSTLTSATAAFTTADTGKRFVLVGGGAGGTGLSGTVTFSNTTAVTLSTPNASGLALANAAFLIGTDDTTAWNNAITALANTGGVIKMSSNGPTAFPMPTISLVTGLVVNKSGITIEGDGKPTQQDTGVPSTFRGSMLAYAGTLGGTLLQTTAVSGAGLPALKAFQLKNIALDGCQGLGGIGWQLLSGQDCVVDSVYVKNFSQVNVDWSTVATLGEATDDTRNYIRGLTIRTLDDPNRQSDGAGFLATTTVAAGSSGVLLSAMTGGTANIQVASTAAGATSAAFPTSGTVKVPFQQTINGISVKRMIDVTYSSTNATALIGATATNLWSGGIGTGNTAVLVTGDPVVLSGGPSAAIGVRLDANPASSPAGNPSNSRFNMLSLVHKHGVALDMRNSDTMRIDDLFAFRASGGVGSAVELWGGANTSIAGRNNLFGKVSMGSGGSGGFLIRGTESHITASFNHQIQYYSRENGEPMPWFGVGAQADYITTAAPSDSTPRIISMSPSILGKISANVVSNAATEVRIVGANVPANTLRVGSTFRIQATGLLTSTATATTSVFRIRIGTTTLTGTIPATASFATGGAARTNFPFIVQADVNVLSVGTAGTAMGNFNFVLLGVSLASSAAGTAAVTINTTVANVAEYTLVAGGASTVLTHHSATIELMP